jgi:hypothetical protein
LCGSGWPQSIPPLSYTTDCFVLKAMEIYLKDRLTRMERFVRYAEGQLAKILARNPKARTDWTEIVRVAKRNAGVVKNNWIKNVADQYKDQNCP